MICFTPPSARPHESLSELIERVTFHNEENGWAVLKVKAKRHRDLVAVVGSLASVSGGEWMTAEGQWVQDKEFGLQFRADMLNSTAPSTKEGMMPETPAREAESDFFFIDRAEPEQIAATVLEMVKGRIPAKFKLDPIRDIHVLCPINRGSLGIRELNVRLQTELNPARPEEPVVEKFGWQFRDRDKITQTESNYDEDVFNGDIGQNAKLDPVEPEVTVRFDQREVVYDFGEMDEVALAYAITIHKSQGSESPSVVIPLATQQYLLLQRNLVYTGIARGRHG